MKKIFGALMIAVCIGMAMPAQAQLKFGVKGGVNLSQLDWDGGYNGNKDNATGFFIGPMAEFTLPIVGLGVDGALMYSQKGKDNFKQQGIDIPLNLKYTIGLGSMLGVYVAAGPDFFFNFAKDKTFGENMKLERKNSQVGINLGAGVKLVKHLQVGVNYNIPLGKSDELTITEGVKGVFTSKTKMWQISAAYIF